MVQYSWDARYSVHVKLIDQQHQQLFSLINQVVDAVQNLRCAQAVDEILPRLVDYTHYHFEEEESRMHELDYPEYKPHKAQHDAFKQKLDQLAEQARDAEEDERASVTLNMLQFLNDWLVQHIGEVDQKMAPFLKEHGVE